MGEIAGDATRVTSGLSAALAEYGRVDRDCILIVPVSTLKATSSGQRRPRSSHIIFTGNKSSTSVLQLARCRSTYLAKLDTFSVALCMFLHAPPYDTVSLNTLTCPLLHMVRLHILVDSLVFWDHLHPHVICEINTSGGGLGRVSYITLQHYSRKYKGIVQLVVIHETLFISSTGTIKEANGTR